MACCLSLVIPNLKLDRLEDFFAKNWVYLKHELESPCFQLIMVTSALTHKQLDSWRLKFPKVKWLAIPQNHGFATTVNLGFTLGCGEWLGTVNDDVILNKDWWQKCIKTADARTGSINPVIYNPEGQVESAGIRVLINGKAEPITTVSQGARTKVDATNGAAVIYRRDTLKLLGFFDERFGSYLEDIDLSLRLKRHGYDNIVANQAKVTHLGHASGLPHRTKAWLDFKNWWLVIAKNWSAQDTITHLPAILLERGRNLSGLLKVIFK